VAFIGTKEMLELEGWKAVVAAARTLGVTLIRAESTRRLKIMVTGREG